MALIGSLSSGISALQSFTDGIQVIGDNIANINTYGYKSSRTNYSDNFNQVLSESSGAAGSAPVSTQIGSSVQVANITSNYSQGNISATGVTTDLAINGQGYFEVVDPNNGGKFVTRAGNFSPDASGYLLTPDGKRLQGLVGGGISFGVTVSNGQLVYTKTSATAPSTVGDMSTSYISPSVGNKGLTLPTVKADLDAVTAAATAAGYTDAASYADAMAPQLSSMAFDTNGNLKFTLTDGNSYTKGQVLLTSFRNQNALVKMGNNLYTNFDAAGPTGGTMVLSAANNTPGTNGLATFRTESLEGSNVDLTASLTDMITVERSFQAASRIITTSDNILQEVVNLKR